MFGSDILNVAIGVVLVHLLRAIIVSAVQEMIARVLKLRWRMLKKGVIELLSEHEPAEELGV